MKNPVSKDTLAQADDILAFWHRLEFFTPFDLSRRAGPSEWHKIFWLYPQDLGVQLAEIHAWHPPEGRRILRADLFAGVFPLSELDRFARELADGQAPGFDDMERGLSEGLSCIARLGLQTDRDLRIDAQDLDLSTLPWAIGRSRRHGLESLGHDAWKASLPALKDRLRHLAEEADRHPPALIVQHVLQALHGWADFAPAPAGQPIACIALALGEQRQAQASAPDDAAEDPEDDTKGAEVGILNSFHIADIELARRQLAEGADIGSLADYLTGVPQDDRIDLYGPAGRKALLRGLMPARGNRGRWMSPPAHAMSLMQQFAINQAIALREGGRLFSVNGPPGTGKTTLLRDIIADNLVARAEVLSRLRSAADAFEGPKLKLADAITGNPVHVSVLRPELRGFGMVVASSNNAAVENISRDLPRRASIDAPEGFGYLQPVARKFAAQKADGTLAALAPEDTPWGLIAAPLGRKANRRKFAQKVFFPATDRSGRPLPPDPAAQTIRDWCQGYQGPAFTDAAAAFRARLARVHALTGEVEHFARLSLVLNGKTLESHTARERAAFGAANQQLEAALARLAQTQARGLDLRNELDELREQERLIALQRPGGLARLLRLQAHRRHQQQTAANATAQLDLHQQIRDNVDRVAEMTCQHQAAGQAQEQAALALDTARASWNSLITELRALHEKGHVMPAGALTDLDLDQVQIRGLWHDERLAEARSALTRAALQLHEAWLAEAGRNGGGFGGNLVAISQMLNGRLVGDPAPIWESLFMMVPVVSTTFASFPSQFAMMGPGSLGWLFIDEAGQAVPQAAVGAMLRARHAVVIGDPLQIEPVFTLPRSLIGALAALSDVTRDGEWSPDAVSVQGVADRANRLGAAITTDTGSGVWIGSPLRVHRRCADPMFTIANEIAYQGKMVFGAARRDEPMDVAPFLGGSCWVDLPGQVTGRQTVPAQVAFMADLIAASARRNGGLPDLYVISPFKEVAMALREHLSRLDPQAASTARRELAAWTDARVGTVHTFQGKEEDAVFMLLGADAAHEGAARWAASRPNLLNVALTRARKRFHVVGDHALWSGLPGFDALARSVPVMSPDEAIRRASQDP